MTGCWSGCKVEHQQVQAKLAKLVGLPRLCFDESLSLSGAIPNVYPRLLAFFKLVCLACLIDSQLLARFFLMLGWTSALFLSAVCTGLSVLWLRTPPPHPCRSPNPCSSFTSRAFLRSLGSSQASKVVSTAVTRACGLCLALLLTPLLRCPFRSPSFCALAGCASTSLLTMTHSVKISHEVAAPLPLCCCVPMGR